MESTLVSNRRILQTNRWDFDYFDPEYIKIIDKIQKSSWSVRALGEVILALTDGQHGYLVHLPEGIPLIRTTNVFENEIRLDDVRYISPEVHAKLKRSNLKPGDVLLVTIGVTLGVAAVVDDSIKEANINQNLVKITPNSEVNSFYLSLFLNSSFGKIQTQTTASKSVVPIVNYPRLRQMLVPVPPLSVQERISQVMEDAYSIYKTKVQQAQEILADINQVILEILEIDFIHLRKEKRFLTKLKQIKGKRFTVDFYLPEINSQYQALQNGKKYQLIPLGKLIWEIANGTTPRGANYPTDGIPFFRIQNITPDGINLSDLCFIDRLTHEEMRRSQTRPGDLLMTITGRLGTAAIVPEAIKEGNINQHIVIIRLKPNTVDVNYLAAVINSPAISFQAEHLATGTTRIALDYKAIKFLLIPVPSLELQNKIVEEVSRRRLEAEALRTEANKLITEVKARVERMILGEEDGA